MATARIDGEWLRCSKCGHKLGRMVGKWKQHKSMPALEIKCHSCKAINYVMIGSQDGKYQEREKSSETELDDLRLFMKGVEYDIR